MTMLALPVSTLRSRRWLPYALATVFAFAAVGGFALVLKFRSHAPTGVAAGKFYSVTPIDFDVKVSKDGELAAVNNIDILNLVEGQSTIVQIVKEGAYAKKGDILVELDSAEIRQKIEDATLEQQKADADLIVAREMRSIQESENAANLEAAEVEVELANLGLKQYVEGTYVQELEDAETLVKMSDIEVKNKEEDLDQTKSLYAKGFVTGSDVKEDELELIEARNKQASSKMKLKVLKEYQYPSDLAEKKSTLVQADQSLARVKKKNASNLSKVVADEKAAEQTLVTKKRRVEHLTTQLALCIIKAPTDGLVVYAGDRNWQQSQIIEGAQVRERQQLLRLPDTSNMKAIVRVNESHVPKLKLGQRASVEIVGVADRVAATLTKISPLADSGSRWWNPDLKEYPVELTLDKTPAEVKPGITVKAVIYTDRVEDALAVPLAAIYANRASNYVFVRGSGEANVKPVEVQIGETNETHARVATGLKAGASVLLLQAGQGRELLERAGISTTSDGSDSGRPAGMDAVKLPGAPAPAAAAQAGAPMPASIAPGAAAAVVPPGSGAGEASAAPPRGRRRDRENRTQPGAESAPGTAAPASPTGGKSSASRVEPTA